jgi:hypothetical protein
MRIRNLLTLDPGWKNSDPGNTSRIRKTDYKQNMRFLLECARYLTVRCVITHHFLGISKYSTIRGFSTQISINQSTNAPLVLCTDHRVLTPYPHPFLYARKGR